eukprot:264220_1
MLRFATKRTFTNKIQHISAKWASTFKLTLRNESGSDSTVGLFQENPNQNDRGYSLVMKNIPTANKGVSTVTWTADNWGVTWSQSDKALTPGATFEGKGPIIPVDPAGTNNCAKIKYNDRVRVWDIERDRDHTIDPGIIGIKTNQSFTEPEARAANMNIAVTMDNEPVFAMPGSPNQNYTFEVYPRYYLSTIMTKKGEAIDGNAISNSTEVEFGSGHGYEMVCTLDDRMGISCISKGDLHGKRKPR